MPAWALHLEPCISIETMQSDLREWGYRGDILKTYAGEEAVEVAPDFEPPAGLVFDAVVSLDVDRGSYVVVLMHDGCMANWRLYTMAGKT